MKRLIFIIVFTIYILTIMLSCRSVKHLTKTIDNAFAKKDSIGKSDSVIVSKDSSKFNSEVIIEYDSTKFEEKLLNGSEIDWDPFYTPQEFEQVMKTIEHPIKRVTIKTNIQVHKSDSAVYHEAAKTKTAIKTEAIKKEVQKKTTSYWWLLLLIIPVLYLLYEKYWPKILKRL